MNPLAQAKQRVECYLTYTTTAIPRMFDPEIMVGPDIPDANGDGMSPGEWLAGDWPDEQVGTVEDWFAHFASMLVQEAIHEALEWFKADGRPWLDPHGILESDIHRLTEILCAGLATLRERSLTSITNLTPNGASPMAQPIIDTWLAEVGEPDNEQLYEAAELALRVRQRQSSTPGSDAQALALSANLWNEPPSTIGALLPNQALHLAIGLVHLALPPGSIAVIDTADLSADRLREAVTGLVPERRDDGSLRLFRESQQQAALMALRQLGGADSVGLPAWVEAAVADGETWAYEACDHITSIVHAACVTAIPGRSWRHIPELGTIIYQTSESATVQNTEVNPT